MVRRNTVAKVGKRVVSFGERGAEVSFDEQQGAEEALADRKRKELIDRLLTVEEAAEILRCSKSALNKWRITGAGPHFVYIGNRIRYRVADIAAFISRRTRASTSASEAPVAPGERRR